jgi:hypothetical protein
MLIQLTEHSGIIFEKNDLTSLFNLVSPITIYNQDMYNVVHDEKF